MSVQNRAVISTEVAAYYPVTAFFIVHVICHHLNEPSPRLFEFLTHKRQTEPYNNETTSTTKVICKVSATGQYWCKVYSLYRAIRYIR